MEGFDSLEPFSFLKIFKVSLWVIVWVHGCRNEQIELDWEGLKIKPRIVFMLDFGFYYLAGIHQILTAC